MEIQKLLCCQIDHPVASSPWAPQSFLASLIGNPGDEANHLACCMHLSLYKGENSTMV